MDIARYIRVSTITQNISRQEVKASKGEILFVDKISGAIPFVQRPQAKLLLNLISQSKVKVLNVASIDRLGRNTKDILTTLEYCQQNNVEVIIENIGLSSRANGKENPIFKLVTTILSSIAEVERDNILERQREGIALALKAGKYKGRLKGTKDSEDSVLAKHADIVKELKKHKLSVREVAQMVGKSKTTVVKVKKIFLGI